MCCIEIVPPDKKYRICCTQYKMQCIKCKRIKLMLGETISAKSGTTHKSCGKGLKNKDKRFHGIWCAMRTRTTNPNYQHWKDYGGRGINSDAFKYFIDFYDTMYESYIEACTRMKTSEVSLERINVNGNYCPENCCWIPLSEQAGNQRTTLEFTIKFPDGTIKKFRNASKFAKEHNLSVSSVHDLIYGRLKRCKGLTLVSNDNKV